MSGKIAIVLSGFPRRSETFALNEVWALEQRGALAAIFATKAGEPVATQPASQALLGRVQVLTECEGPPQAEEVIRLLNGTRVSAIHGYFAHAPAEVAELVSMQLGIPFGFSVHARDARKVAPEVLSARARKAACVVACNRDVAWELQDSGAQVHLVPHGVDLERFAPQPFPETRPLQLLAVGRLVEKKGFHILIDAAARLRVPFQLDIVGEGPEEKRLAELIRAHGLESKVQTVRPEDPSTICRRPTVAPMSWWRPRLSTGPVTAMVCPMWCWKQWHVDAR